MLMRRGMESEGSLFGEKVEWFGADLGFNWEDDSFLGLGRDAVCTSSGVDFRREGEVEGEEQEGGFGGREEYGGLTRENAWEIGDLLEKFLEEGGLGEESGFDAVGSSGVGLGADISNYYGPSLTSLNEEELTSYGVHEDAGVYEATQEVCAASKPVQLGRVKNKREVKILQRAHHPGSALPSKEAAELSVDKRLRILERGDRDAVDEELDRYGRRDRRKFISRSQRPESFEVPATEGGLYKTDGQPQFASMENLTAELKGIAVQEVKEKACKCTSCGKSFARKYTLIQHMRIHSNERTHKCPVEGCGKQFVQKANLSQHMRYHTGEKPYECDEPYCYAAFHQLANLKSHLKAKHGRDVPRKCRIRNCGKGFVTAEELAEHLRVDHGRTSSQTSSQTTSQYQSSITKSNSSVVSLM